MDKKRRNNKTASLLQKKTVKRNSLRHALKLTANNYTCGVNHKKYSIIKDYGTGYYESFAFSDITISILKATLSRTMKLKWAYSKPFFELGYLINGEQLIQLDTSKHTLVYESLDSYFINLKDTSGTITYLKNKSYNECKIYLKPSFIKKYLSYDMDFNVISKKTFYKTTFKTHCEHTQHILTEIITNRQQGLFKRLFLESKVLDLLRLYLTKNTNTITAIATKNTNYIKKLYRVQTIISSDISKHYTINELARLTGLNDFILKKEFKATFNKTIFEYVSHLRMKKAKKLLKHTQKPIYEIAECVGYKNATHFSAAFKRHFDISPKTYRLENLKV